MIAGFYCVTQAALWLELMQLEMISFCQLESGNTKMPGLNVPMDVICFF